MGVQFHPEFKSKPNQAQPLFAAFVKAALKRQATGGAKPAKKAGKGTAKKAKK